ncbi:MAG: DUF5063 domain-containing protein [Muribaculaceae bacterium]|nr:DUF5063 domain-containing protein [Muribaculaceae bacterium]
MTNQNLNNNSLTLIALCNEYCQAVEMARESTQAEFIDAMARLLPRIYITAYGFTSDIEADVAPMESLDEESYNRIRSDVEQLLGSRDTYLEVFEDDMKYSDTPIAASVSEGIADLFQIFFNFIESIKDAPSDQVEESLAWLRYDFETYWSQILCNIMRPINHIALNPDEE